MTEYDDFDLDRTTMRAWSRFQANLADHVVGMEDGDVLVVAVETSRGDDVTGAAPYVWFCAWGGDLARAEVSSNEYLARDMALDDDAVVALLDLGWTAPTRERADEPDAGSANLYLDAPRREGDRLAAMAVAALRDVFGVPHPAFLRWPGADVGDDAGTEPGDSTSKGWEEEPLAVEPESTEHLRALVDAALSPPGGPPIEHDEEGDIPLPNGSALLFVSVNDDAPVVELFSVVVRGVRDLERAAVEVGILNRDNRLLKFVLVGDSVIATLNLPAVPFAPRQLRTLVSAMADLLDRIDDDLVARVGGRRAFDPEPEVDDEEEEEGAPEETSLHPALLTLLHLDPEGEGGVDPELAASVCEHDRDLVLTFLTKASEQEIDWRKSGDAALIAGDTDEAEACFHEGRGWQATVETLRLALRVIVEQRHAGATASGASVQVGRARRPGAARRHPATGEGVQESLIDDASIRRDSTGQDTLFDRGSDA